MVFKFPRTLIPKARRRGYGEEREGEPTAIPSRCVEGVAFDFPGGQEGGDRSTPPVCRTAWVNAGGEG